MISSLINYSQGPSFTDSSQSGYMEPIVAMTGKKDIFILVPGTNQCRINLVAKVAYATGPALSRAPRSLCLIVHEPVGLVGTISGEEGSW